MFKSLGRDSGESVVNLFSIPGIALAARPRRFPSSSKRSRGPLAPRPRPSPPSAFHPRSNCKSPRKSLARATNRTVLTSSSRLPASISRYNKLLASVDLIPADGRHRRAARASFLHSRAILRSVRRISFPPRVASRFRGAQGGIFGDFVWRLTPIRDNRSNPPRYRSLSQR